ncbi:MAG: Gfo/Idh/MocA family oxidoreductase [Ruminococcaceae bacterium]|nr:Gfo/Idh/MocA family oxidoreductase [Oscillospiraceae bacterium]
MKKIKIAQIGMSQNSHGDEIFKFINNSDLFEVVGYALPENEREKFPNKMHVFEGCREMTVEEILNDPEIEAVTVETEEIYLTKYALMAAEHKKHMHMEKPGSQNLKDFEKLIETVKKNKTVFHTGYMYRYNPYISKLLERIKNGELGDIISVEAQMSCKHSDEIRNWLSCFEGGIMFFLGCHLVDLILQIQGMPKNIIPFNKCTKLNGTTSEDYSMAVFEYDKGVSFAKTTSVERGGFLRRQLVVTGTKGMIEVKPLETTIKYPLLTTSYKEVIGDDDWNANSDVITTEQFDRYTAMLTSFAKMVLGEKENPWSYDYELELYKTVLKCCGK